MNKDKILKDYPSLKYADGLREICKPLEVLDIFYFSHVQIDEKGKFSALGMEPGFVKLYLEKEYYRYDIHMAQSTMPEQYIIWDSIERIKESKELFDDFTSFSLGHTFTISQHYGKSKEYFHFAGKLENTGINCNYLSHLALLKKFILYFKDKINTHKELKRGLNVKFEIPREKSGYLMIDKQAINLNEFNSTTSLERYYLDSENYITYREVECLYWLSQGKTLDEIALVLNITPRTVKAHIKNIKQKFNYNNLFQLGTLYSKLPKIIVSQ